MSQTIALVRHSRADMSQQAALIAAEVRRLGGTLLDEDHAREADVVLVLGGDGTMLRAVETVRGSGIPLVGVNYGHVGFLAEADPESLAGVVARLVAGEYKVEERMALELTLAAPDGAQTTGWALNEVAILKMDRARMVELTVAVDGHAVNAFGCDGFVVATPTGSTAYAFSAGGPIVWPDLEALLAVPLAAHALFARPMVVGPHSEVSLVLRSDSELSCDSRRNLLAPAHSTVTVRRSPEPVRLARLSDMPFSGRLVAKFNLPVTGWRGA